MKFLKTESRKIISTGSMLLLEIFSFFASGLANLVKQKRSDKK